MICEGLEASKTSLDLLMYSDFLLEACCGNVALHPMPCGLDTLTSMGCPKRDR